MVMEGEFKTKEEAVQDGAQAAKAFIAANVAEPSQTVTEKLDGIIEGK